jgi:EAL domain-containing protein (putative c-di-GMP-specific phosphodiesterase class I)
VLEVTEGVLIDNPQEAQAPLEALRALGVRLALDDFGTGSLGHTLGMKVLAEGVEKDEQRVLLRLAGCDEMQGFLFAKSRPAAEIDQALARPTRFATA